MKQLNILKPDIHTGYLNYGKGQEITYLQVPENVTYKELEQDIASGAKHFEELREFAKKKPSRFVVINCNKREEGLMAVSYLSAIYNRIDGIDPYDYDDDELEDEINLDFDEEDILGLNDDDDDDEEWEAESQWEENPWKIPVIESNDISADFRGGFNPFFSGGIGMGSVANPKNRLPYWYYTRRENICIMHNLYWGMLGGDTESLTKSFKRYKNNRHVFLIVINDSDHMKVLGGDDDTNLLDPGQQAICETVLEYAAGTVNVAGDEKDIKNYYCVLFENWIKQMGYSLKKGFPVNRVTEAIVGINNDDKSALMEKVIKYVIKEERDNNVLGEEDFNILNRFKLIGANLEKKETKSIKKLESELIGMDDVKEQIKGIVQVMRYNKRRKKMGLPTSNYHNVHMMLGAPGTAKTTVAELLGNMMAEEKLLSNNRFVSVNGAELKGMYVGHSAPKVKALFDHYDIILIDEAYAVAAGRDGDTDSFSQEAIAQLIVELEKHGMDRLVIFAGYGGVNVSERDNKMKAFLNANPGIRSRINSTIFFESYTAKQMVDIFHCHAKINGFSADKSANALIEEFFEGRHDRRDFGNGREARSLLENAVVEAAKRLALINEDDISEEQMQELTKEDIANAIEKMRLGLDMQLGKEGNKCGFAC